MLLDTSSHPEMRAARSTFDEYFEKVRRLLLHSKGDKNSAIWKAAFRLLSFPEIQGTCLGYGEGSISGSGSGPVMTDRLATTGFQVASLGIDDPDLFMAVGLFEEDFGPDMIGDMFTNVCFAEIIEFNNRITQNLGVPVELFAITLRNGLRYEARFPRNPLINSRRVPVILMPLDVLRDLPVALDWSGIQQTSEENKSFRDSLNANIASLWSRKTLESKSRLKEWATSSSDSFGDLLDMIHGMDGKPYDFANDKLGEFVWRNFAERINNEFPLCIEKPKSKDALSTAIIVDKIIEQFRHLIEERDLWREFYTDNGQPRLEKSAQRLFYMTALSYCEANNLDVTPEAETGRGPVDFKFSTGINDRILVEMKLSRNPKVPQGFAKQLDIYNSAEKAFSSKYIIIDVGGMGKKLKQVEAAREIQISQTGAAPEVLVIDATPRLSASKA
ncbi:hypothetical protein [Sphingomonas sp. MA1305]|uniref:hypothetical protein n=1 Tax=Sphingomonas sp. MA1305 TaxID=2479204 RepID=UPI0018DFCDE8|nr:hypothetical protein [Sphingomonas sp. MA1305]